MLLPSHSRKPRVFLFFVFVLVLVSAGIASSAYTYTAVTDAGRSHIVDRVNTIASLLPAEEIMLLSGSESDEAVPAYQTLKTLLTNVREVNSDARFVYLIGQRAEGEMFFFVDSEPSSSEDYSPPGQVYEEATPGMYAVFTDGASQSEGPDKDRWGVWISGYAPVYGSDGSVIALLGMDLPAENFIVNAAVYALAPLLVAIFFLVILVASWYVRQKEMRTIEQKAEFLSIASHEIRTPLTGIRWALEGVLHSKTVGIAAEERSILTMAHDTTLTLIARINNLLEVAALEGRNRLTLTKQPIVVRALITSIVESLALSARESQVALVIDDSVTETLSIMADEQGLRHAFFNLISNAIKYTKPHTEVRISYAHEKDGHAFSITDHGKGIAPEDQKRIFDGYHRTASAVHSGQYGTGLGLYLTKRVVTLHGGIIRTSSSPDVGTTFTIVLP